MNMTIPAVLRVSSALPQTWPHMQEHSAQAKPVTSQIMLNFQASKF